MSQSPRRSAGTKGPLAGVAENGATDEIRRRVGFPSHAIMRSLVVCRS